MRMWQLRALQLVTVFDRIRQKLSLGILLFHDNFEILFRDSLHVLRVTQKISQARAFFKPAVAWIYINWCLLLSEASWLNNQNGLDWHLLVKLLHSNDSNSTTYSNMAFMWWGRRSITWYMSSVILLGLVWRWAMQVDAVEFRFYKEVYLRQTHTRMNQHFSSTTVVKVNVQVSWVTSLLKMSSTGGYWSIMW